MDDITIARVPKVGNFLEEFQTREGELSWYLGCAFERDNPDTSGFLGLLSSSGYSGSGECSLDSTPASFFSLLINVFLLSGVTEI